MYCKKPTVLIVNKYFPPAYKAGGPIRTLFNMTEHLSNEFNFIVLTGDRDAGDKSSFSNLKINEWNDVFGCKVMYLSPEKFNITSIKKILNSIDYDLIYLNSFFSKLSIIVLFLYKFGAISNMPLLLAPRGEFSSGALSIKSFKKKSYISVIKTLKFYRGITWQASSIYEKKDIMKHLKGDVFVASDLPPKRLDIFNKKNKKKGTLRLIYVSRITKMKNLYYSLNILSKISEYSNNKIIFDIYGPISDRDYYNKCYELMLKLSDNINCNYRGEIPHEKVFQVLQKYHIFFLSTLGENYGHVIIEALSSGCPVIISDRTPWRGLEEKKVGWDISLENEEKYIKVLQKCIDMGQEEYNKLSKNAYEYGKKFIENDEIVKKNREMFRYAINKKTK